MSAFQVIMLLLSGLVAGMHVVMEIRVLRRERLLRLAVEVEADALRAQVRALTAPDAPAGPYRTRSLAGRYVPGRRV